VYQRQPADFGYKLDNVELMALALRKEWALTHAKQHSEREHRNLRLSGNQFTPAASHKLAAFGVIPLGDALPGSEVEAALRESSPIPDNDCEGT